MDGNGPKLDSKTAQGLKPNVHQIRIDSILGGHSLMSHMASTDQFLGSRGIDPAEYPVLSTTSGQSAFIQGASGILRPVGATKISGSTIQNNVMWMIPNPKDNNRYVYDAQGSAYTIDVSNNVTALSDGGSLSSSSGNGCAYYDNYIYFAKNTTIARYGPLDGTPSFNGDYWVGTLGKTQLTDTSNYPTASGVTLPNHYLHRHSDGRLYIADVVGGQGAIHYIKTTKTTVEGDTNDGSTYLAFTYGYGMKPTCMESLGANLAIAFYEGTPSVTNAKKKMGAKIVFWDTSSPSANTIIFEEFPDDTVTALKNINGSLKIISGTTSQAGFRLSNYVGGQSIQEDRVFREHTLPLPGAIYGTPTSVLFGSRFSNDASSALATVFSYGLRGGISSGLFAVGNTTADDNASIITAIAPGDHPNATPYIAWKGSTRGIDIASDDCSSTYGYAMFLSQIYKVGSPFKVTKIKLPLAQKVASGAILEVVVWTDNFQNKYTVDTINFTDFPSKQLITLKPPSCVGKTDMVLSLKWTGTAQLAVSLPITIQYEFTEDE